jgi:hypothetical protein
VKAHLAESRQTHFTVQASDIFNAYGLEPVNY